MCACVFAFIVHYEIHNNLIFHRLTDFHINLTSTCSTYKELRSEVTSLFTYLFQFETITPRFSKIYGIITN